MKVHDVQPAPGSTKGVRRVGRGIAGKGGKTAGGGTKGQAARGQIPASFEGGQLPLHMRIPKLKGFKNPFKTEYQVVNTGDLGGLFPDGGAVGVADLVAKGAVRSGLPVKIHGTGQLTVALHVTVHAFSASARSAIEAAGGSATTI